MNGEIPEEEGPMSFDRRERKTQLSKLLKLNSVRLTKFALIGFTSFLVVEAALALLLALGAYPLFATPMSYELSIVYGFVMNDRITISKDKGPHSLLSRLGRYNAVYVLGIGIATLTVVLLSNRGVQPLVANIAGACLSFPVNYAISMVTVWKQKLS